MNKHIKLLSIICLTVAAGMIINCGSSYRINYSNVKADLNYSGTRSVAVGVLDKRTYVISGENDPKFVGTMRGGYGNRSISGQRVIFVCPMRWLPPWRSLFAAKALK